MDFKYNMTLKELKKRTSKRHYKPVKFLSREDKEIKELSKDDLMVLCHLTRAAFLIEKVQFQLENVKNPQILAFLNKEIKNGSEKAKLAKRMFMSQKSNFSPDLEGNQTAIFKNVNEPLGQGYFPEEITADEFHEILNKMIDSGKTQEVQKILNQRSVVRRDGQELKAIDFVDAFPEFMEIAKELELAKKFSHDEKFNKFLELQIKALEKADPMLDAYADKAWSELDENTRFEFTITRECYDERLTKTISDNDELSKKLADNNITVYAKDSLGARVGLVNVEGTKLLNKLKTLVGISEKFMPYKEEYEHKKSGTLKQIAVDVDLIALTGEEGAYQAGIVTAQNLPNSDKLAFTVGGGNRNVYHRQVRNSGNNSKNYKKLIAKEFWKYYNPEADHWAVICHENTHSLGPKSKELGKFSSILEEYKADMGMYAFLDEFKAENCFSDFETKQIMVTGLLRGFMKGKPTLEQAHRTRSLMICNRMLSEKALTLDEEQKLHFDFEKIKALTKTMLAEVIRIQIDGDIKKAEEYVSKWAVWTDEIEKVAEIIRSYNKKLNGYVEDSLAQEFLNPDFEASLKN